jgi:molybdenum-dependent DNA-binding transcriptional regulator ModE
MIAFSRELWFNLDMLKTEAIQHLGGSVAAAAKLLGVSYNGVRKWPDALPRRISDRVLGAMVRNGLPTPKQGRRKPAGSTGA